MIDIHDLIERNRSGETIGLPCFCTANEQVLRTALSHAARTGFPTVIEATCNQVNQDGGYTRMTPRDFMAWLTELADEAGVPMDRLMLGGDHLGPNPWRTEPAELAMEKARELVRLYVEAGFRKIHLDASMPLGGESALSFAEIADRAAELCAVAEAHAPDPSALIYVIGTEVPIPGGETEEPDALDVTSVERFRDTISSHREAWAARGLDAAWPRIVSVVTQPGVDFGHSTVYEFDPHAASDLSQSILDEPGLSFEAHSTDYQPTAALRSLVEKHFFFLKVGPELTFRFREAVFALAAIEAELDPAAPSHLLQVIDRRMTERDEYWRDYYRGDEKETARLRRYSYSDRIRYYWTDPDVSTALSRLVGNLRQADLPETVVSQVFAGLDFEAISTDPDLLLQRHIELSVERYFAASGHS